MRSIRSRTMAALLAGLVPGAAHAGVDITLAPRAWYLVDALAGGDLPTTSGATGTLSFNSPPFTVFMKGGSVSLHSDETLPNTTLTATALFGSDTKTLTTRGATLQTFPQFGGLQQIIFSSQRAREHLKRSDFELTAQTRVNDLLSWTLGIRYERARVGFLSTVTNQASNPFTGMVDTTTVTSAPFKGGYDLYTARAGVALLAPMNEARTDLLYGNAMAFVGRRDNRDHISAPQYDDATFIGPDVAVGYTHRFGPKVSLDMRYRALFFFPISGAGKFGQPKATHGPNVAVTYTF